MAEDQTGPQSPSPADNEDHGRLGGSVDLDHAASRRIRPGTKAADMHEGPPLIELADVCLLFQPFAEWYAMLTFNEDRLGFPIDRTSQSTSFTTYSTHYD